MGDSVSFGFDIKDVQTLVDMYLSKESGKLNRLTQKQKLDDVKITLLGQLKGAVNALQTNISNVVKSAQTLSYTASVSNAALLSAKIISNANLFPASHQINVTQLASNQVRQCNNTVSSRNAALSMTGDLAFTIGANSFSVNVAATDTLENIRDNINTNAANVGVTASIVSSTDGSGNTVYSLAVASNKTGTVNGFTVGGSLGGVGKSFDFSQENSAALDAIFTFDNMNQTLSSNDVTGVMDGVSFTLLGTGTSTLTIKSDQVNMADSLKKSIHTMVDSYNQVMSLINNNFAQSAADRKLNDESLVSVHKQLRDLFSTTSSTGSIRSFYALGVTLAPTTTIVANPSIKEDPSNPQPTDGRLKPVRYFASGALQINDTVLSQLITDDLHGVISFFQDATDGFDKLASKAISKITLDTIPDQSNALDKEVAILKRNIDGEHDRLDSLRLNLIDKFTSLLELVKKSEGMSNYLEKQFSVLTFKK